MGTWGFRDIGYLSFYFQGYGILSILLQGISDSVFNILLTVIWKIGYRGYVPVYLNGYGILELACLLRMIIDIGTPYEKQVAIPQNYIE